MLSLKLKAFQVEQETRHACPLTSKWELTPGAAVTDIQKNPWVQRLQGPKGTLPSSLGARLMKGRPNCIGITGADLRGGL